MSQRPGRGPAVAAVLLALAAALAGSLAPVLAQEPDDRPAASLTLASVTRVLGPGSIPPPEDPGEDLAYATDLDLRVLVENTGPVPLTGAQLVVELHPPMLTRGLLANALDGDLTGPPLHVHTQPVRVDRPLPAGDIAGLRDHFPRAEVAWAGDSGGVHPVRVAVLLGTEVLDEFVTAVVWLNDSPGTPMLTTFAWPVDTVPWRGPAGTYPAGLERETRPGSRLDRLVNAVERGPNNVPVVLAPAAHLLEDLSDRSDGYLSRVRGEDGKIEYRTVGPGEVGASESAALLRRIRELAAEQLLAPVSSSYADADLAALLLGDSTHAEVAAVAASDGRRRVQLQLGTPVDGATHLVGDRISPAVLDVLPGESVLLPTDTTDLPPVGADPDLGHPVRTLRAPSGRLLTALVGDPYLTHAFDQLDQPAGSIAASQRILAETALAYLTAPAAAGRGLVLLPDRTWDPPGATAEDVLLALSEASWLRFVAPSALATEALRDPAGIGLSTPVFGALSPALGRDLTAAWAGLNAAVGASPPGTTRLGERSVEQLRDDLLRSTSRWHRGAGEGEAAALVRDVGRVIDATFGDVSVSTASVTLTSDTGQVPVTLQRTRGGPILVSVAVESQGRLLWPEGRRSEVIELDEGSSATVSFATRAVSTGTFPVTVTITDPSGTTELARGTLSVRSTAISQPALTAMAALVVVLLLVGSLRRPERPKLALVGDTDDPDGPGAPG